MIPTRGRKAVAFLEFTLEGCWSGRRGPRELRGKMPFTRRCGPVRHIYYNDYAITKFHACAMYMHVQLFYLIS